MPWRRERRGPLGGAGLSEFRRVARSAGWTLFFIIGGLALAILPFLLAKAARLPVGRLLEGPGGLAAQAVAQLAAFGFLTWAIGRRYLRMSWESMGWVREHRVAGFFLGLVGASLLASAAMLVSVVAGHASWVRDAGGVLDYLRNLGFTILLLAPAALAEELMFRGFPLVKLEQGIGRGGAIVVLAVLFALLHAWNPDVTPLALGNIALAGVLLGLAFYCPGGIWTSWGAHLGWNASLAALDAPVSGLPFQIPLIDFDPGPDTWLSGGKFGPEGGLAATLVLTIGCAWLAHRLRKDAEA